MGNNGNFTKINYMTHAVHIISSGLLNLWNWDGKSYVRIDDRGNVFEISLDERRLRRLNHRWKEDVRIDLSNRNGREELNKVS